MGLSDLGRSSKWQGLLWCPVCGGWTLFSPTYSFGLREHRQRDLGPGFPIVLVHHVQCSRCKYRLEVNKYKQERLANEAQLLLQEYLSRGGSLGLAKKLAADERLIRRLREEWSRQHMTASEIERRLRAHKEAKRESERSWKT